MTHGFRAMFTFNSEDLAPIIAMQQTALQDTVLRNFNWQSLMNESLYRRQHGEEQASILAQAASAMTAKSADDKEQKQEKDVKDAGRSYTITYYNPELHKAEIVQEKVDIKIKDYATKAVEESVASQSVYPIYTYIGLPLMKTEVIPWKLQEILSEREYGTPPPPPTGAGVTPVKVITEKESEIEAVKKREESIRDAIGEAIIRKEKMEMRTAEEIIVMEDAIAALRGGEDIDKIIDRLPPLSRARYILTLRKMRLGREALTRILIQDCSFLKTVKKKLELFTLDDLVSMFKLLRNLQKK